MGDDLGGRSQRLRRPDPGAPEPARHHLAVTATTARGDVFWKTPAIVAWAGGRPFAWLDDDITDGDVAWVAEHHSGAALLRRIDPSLGLLPQDFSALKEWALALGAQ